jgi:lambda repressor-like predicted transcriptional regulator
MSPWDIVTAELSRRGKNLTWLADELGTSLQRVQNWKTRGIPSGQFRAVASALGVTVDQLEGLVPIEGWISHRGGTEEIQIRQFDTGGSMGGGLVLRDQPGVIKSWNVTSEWVQKNVRSFSAIRNLAIVTGFGDSMRPMFNPGDPLLIDCAVRAVDFDSVYFFRVENEGYVKRLQRVPGQGLVVISENKAYRDWTITPDMDFEVLGRIVKVWRGDDF